MDFKQFLKRESDSLDERAETEEIPGNLGHLNVPRHPILSRTGRGGPLRVALRKTRQSRLRRGLPALPNDPLDRGIQKVGRGVVKSARAVGRSLAPGGTLSTLVRSAVGTPEWDRSRLRQQFLRYGGLTGRTRAALAARSDIRDRGQRLKAGMQAGALKDKLDQVTAAGKVPMRLRVSPFTVSDQEAEKKKTNQGRTLPGPGFRG